MDITLLHEELYDAYTGYLASHPNALLYYSLNYHHFLKTLLNCQAHYLVAQDKGKVVGILPLMSQARNGYTVYNSLPFFGSHGGPLADNGQIEAELLHAYNEIVARQETSASTLISHPFIQTPAHLIKHNYTDCRIGMWTDLSFTHSVKNELLDKIHPSARRNINRALKENFTVKVMNDRLADLQILHQDNMQRIGGTAKTSAFFSYIPKYFIPGKDYNLYVALCGEKIIAALLLFYFGSVVEYFIPAIHDEYKTTQPLSLLIFQAMQDAAQKGFKLWNWGGTWQAQTGVYQFKKKWATLECQYHYYTQVNQEQLTYFNKEKLLSYFPNFYVLPFEQLQGIANA